MSSELWSELYEAAVSFRDKKFWSFMDDTMIFGVENPVTGETNYCVVLGHGGEVFSFQVYLGEEGLWSYLNLKECGDRSCFFALKLVEVSFEDREALFPEDLAQIKKLGLSFRGRKQWPMFRSYLPGYFPWFLSEEEGKLLLTCLQQALEVCPLFEKGPEGEGVLVRKFVGDQWVTEWVEPPEVEGPYLPPLSYSEVEVHRAGKLNPSQAVWEADVRIVGQAIQEKKGGRPIYPYTCVVLDKGSGMIINFEILSPGNHLSDFASFIMETMVRAGYRPEKIQVPSFAALVALDELGEMLSFQVARGKVRELDKAFKELSRRLG